MKDKGKEFERPVREHSDWTDKILKKPPNKGKLEAFLEGFISVFDIFGTNRIKNNPTTTHPIYSRRNLTSQQKNIIALGCDWYRVKNRLEKITSQEKYQTPQEITMKEIAEKMYQQHRKNYITST